jgi:hypothetical protein
VSREKKYDQFSIAWMVDNYGGFVPKFFLTNTDADARTDF